MTKLSAKKRQNGFVEVPEPAYLFFKFSFGIWLRRYVTGAFVKRVSEACFSIDPVNYRSQGAYFCRSCVHWDRHIDGFYYQTREISRNYMEIIAFWAKTRSIILTFLNIFFYILKHGFGPVKLNGPKGSTDIKLGCFAQFASSSSPNWLRLRAAVVSFL